MTYSRQTLTPKLELIVHPDELESGELVREALEGGSAVLQETWQLHLRRRCQVWVVPSLDALAASNPFYARAGWWLRRRVTPQQLDGVWRWVSGWTLKYLDRTIIAIKPLEVLAETIRKSRRPLFSPASLPERLQNCAVHELTHACTPQLFGTPWLNEGIAILSVDHYRGRATVLPEALSELTTGKPPSAYRKLARFSEAEVAGFYSLSYWLTRYLFETYRDTLRDWLKKPRKIEAKLASLLGLPRRELWRELPDLLKYYFGGTHGQYHP